MNSFARKCSAGISLVFILVMAGGCAGEKYLQGCNANGEKVYLGPVPIENTEPYQTYIHSARTEADKQRYLFQRLKNAAQLSFYHEGSWYNSLLAYRGGMWLMRECYVKGQNTRDFIKKHVEYSEDTHEYHLAKFPDGSMHIGSYLLYNELDLLERTAEDRK